MSWGFLAGGAFGFGGCSCESLQCRHLLSQVRQLALKSSVEPGLQARVSGVRSGVRGTHPPCLGQVHSSRHRWTLCARRVDAARAASASAPMRSRPPAAAGLRGACG